MKLKQRYENQDDIPEQFRELYTESGATWILTGIEGVKTQEDVDKLNDSLRKEREDHKKTKEKLSKFGELDPDKVHEQLDEIDELRLKSEGKELDEDKLEQLVESRVARKLAPVERERDRLKSENERLAENNTELSGTITRGKIHDELRKVAGVQKVNQTAQDDILMYDSVFEVADDGTVVTRDGVGVTPGLTPDLWLNDMKEKRPHWWPPSQGAGANGGQGGFQGGKNPWSKEHWNMTEQGRFLNEHGREKADAAAKAAGTTVGATRPQ